MTTASQELGERFEQHLFIAAPPAAVFDCFFSAEALRTWWQAVVGHDAGAVRRVRGGVGDDAVPRRIAGRARRRVSRHRRRRQARQSLGGRRVVGAAERPPDWPDGAPGRVPAGRGRLRSPRPSGRLRTVPALARYYAVASRGWQISLAALKRYLESSAAPPIEP